MQKFIKAIVLATALALPALFTNNAFATNANCGTCVVGNAPNTPQHIGVNVAKMACSSCHATTGNGNSGGNSGGTLTPKPTSKSCGACAVGTAPMGVGAHKNVTATTLCSVCHTSTSTGGSSGGAVGIYPTTHSCGACVVGTAPGSVSAHKNVNANKTVCSVCHMTGTTSGHTDNDHGTTGGHTDNDHGTTGGTGNHHDDDHHQTSPGNSDFGHSHKHDKQSHDYRRDHDD